MTQKVQKGLLTHTLYDQDGRAAAYIHFHCGGYTVTGPTAVAALHFVITRSAPLRLTVEDGVRTATAVLQPSSHSPALLPPRAQRLILYGEDAADVVLLQSQQREFTVLQEECVLCTMTSLCGRKVLLTSSPGLSVHDAALYYALALCMYHEDDVFPV